MAIFHAPHKTIGKSTHAAGTAAAHVAYVTREQAASVVLAEHMPTARREAREWMLAAEASDSRKNARVCDKLTLALPLELDAAQRADLVRDLMERIGGGRIAWVAGIHDKGDDAHNPHAHIVFRDKDHESGKKVFGTSEKGSTERLRELWETVQNEALERAGSDARVDRRSLAAQGIDRTPGIHVGPAVLAMEERGERPESREQEAPYRDGVRVIDWPGIDQGRTRADRQREIEAANDDERGEKGKGDGGISLDVIRWAEQEADRRADAQQRTQELLDQARRATGRGQVDEARTPEIDRSGREEDGRDRLEILEQLAQLEAEERALAVLERAAAERQAAEDRTAELLAAARRATLAPARAEPEAAAPATSTSTTAAVPAIAREAPAADRQRQAKSEPEPARPQPIPTRELTRDERLAAEEAADLAADRARRDRATKERQQQRAARPEVELARAVQEIAITDQATAQRMGWTPGASIRFGDQVPAWQRIAEARQVEQERQDARQAEQERQEARNAERATAPRKQAVEAPKVADGPMHKAEPERPQARPWTAERGGFDELGPEQQRQAETSFARWQQQREESGQATTWGLSRYVAFVQAREAERQARPGVEGLIEQGKRRAQQGAARLRRQLGRGDDDDGRELGR